MPSVLSVQYFTWQQSAQISCEHATHAHNVQCCEQAIQSRR